MTSHFIRTRQPICNQSLMQTWQHDNKLTLNITKSKRIRSLWSLKEVSWSDHKQHLTWHDHIQQLQSKIAKRLGVLKLIKHLLPVYARRIYVSTMVIPILEYASIVWGDKNNKVLMDSI